MEADSERIEFEVSHRILESHHKRSKEKWMRILHKSFLVLFISLLVLPPDAMLLCNGGQRKMSHQTAITCQSFIFAPVTSPIPSLDTLPVRCCCFDFCFDFIVGARASAGGGTLSDNTFPQAQRHRTSSAAVNKNDNAFKQNHSVIDTCGSVCINICAIAWQIVDTETVKCRRKCIF